MITRKVTVSTIILTAVFLTIGTANAQWLETPAERTNHQQDGTLYEPLMEFVYELESRTELMSVQKITETLMGRDVVLCILSDPPAFRPEDVRKTGRPVVLIVNNVHGGEVAGKDASLALMRDLVMGDLRPLLETVVVLNVPTINPDGAEVNRRTNEQGFDLNRDYIKLESQEIHSLVTDVINRWHPDIHVDTHHGGSAPYTLTYQTCMNPAGDPELIKFGNEVVLPRIRDVLRAEGYEGFWYTGPGSVDGIDGWVPTSVEPRKQHVYSVMANMVGFLFESPSNTHRVINNGTEVISVPDNERYRHRVRGQYIGQRELIRFASEHAGELRDVIKNAKIRALELGSNDSDNDEIPLEYRQEVKFYENYWLPINGESRDSREQNRTTEYKLVNGPVFTKFEPTITTPRPWGYLMPPGLAEIIPLLLEHEIAVKRLTEPATVEVEAYYAYEIRHAEYFQGHYLKQVKVNKRIETLTFPAGSFFVPAGQPKSHFICYILEPETDDNLVTWGYLDNFLRVTPAAGEQQNTLQRPQRQQQNITNQRIPIYRLMKKTLLKGMLVQPFHEHGRNRFMKY